MLSEVPEGWQKKELEQLLSLSTPGFWGKEAGVEDADIMVLRATNFTKDGIRYDTAALRSFPSKKIEQKKLEKGDLLLERSGGSAAQPVGRIRYFDAVGDYSFSNFFQLLRVDNDHVKSDYAYYMLDHFYKNGNTVQLQKATTGIRNLAYKDYLAIKFLTPPLTEQKRIAEVLSSVDESIQATQRLIEQAERVKQGLMEELLTGGLGSEAIERGEVPAGWQVIHLGFEGLQLLDGDRGKNYPKSTDFSDSGFCLFLSAKNITKRGLELKELQFISEEKHNSLRKGSVERGDIVITTRGTVGNVAIFNDSCAYKVCRINSGMAIIRNRSESVSSEYLYAYLASKVVDAQIKNMTHGSAQPALTLKTLKTIKLALPTIEMQESIVQRVKSLADVVETNEVKLRALEQTKKGLMDDLLTGKVRTI
ncbi:restriction endonuclease subunit S [Pseudidiomarina sp. 1APP75-32.1]|uniref:Restriction endonuclease subunit S n=1 Tax=Pseudidiomarina terrestris TaxID=2820060 RepID=A0AAW7QYH6_9GAMM|nr:restriction endonuclease subunit S [Pseudidiomarina sp. 1APP75-32.1]MDN7125212.1 restriction endonuclease subunit S [Pseudidiomarina sp. 1APP75-32.1]